MALLLGYIGVDKFVHKIMANRQHESSNLNANLNISHNIIIIYK